MANYLYTDAAFRAAGAFCLLTAGSRLHLLRSMIAAASATLNSLQPRPHSSEACPDLCN